MTFKLIYLLQASLKGSLLNLCAEFDRISSDIVCCTLFMHSSSVTGELLVCNRPTFSSCLYYWCLVVRAVGNYCCCRSVVHVCSVLRQACFGCYDNSLYMLLSNRICTVIDVLSHHLAVSSHHGVTFSYLLY